MKEKVGCTSAGLCCFFVAIFPVQDFAMETKGSYQLRSQGSWWLGAPE